MLLKVTQSCLTLCEPWTIQSMEFSRPEYQSGQIFPSPGDLPNPGIKSRSPALQADSLPESFSLLIFDDLNTFALDSHVARSVLLTLQGPQFFGVTIIHFVIMKFHVYSNPPKKNCLIGFQKRFSTLGVFQLVHCHCDIFLLYYL